MEIIAQAYIRLFICICETPIASLALHASFHSFIVSLVYVIITLPHLFSTHL